MDIFLFGGSFRFELAGWLWGKPFLEKIKAAPQMGYRTVL
jgi:hypothetical protein